MAARTVFVKSIVAGSIFALWGSSAQCVPPSTGKTPAIPGSNTKSSFSKTETKPAAGSTNKPLKENFIDLGPFMVQMQKKISKNWHPPKVLKSVTIKWQVLPSGQITGLRVDKSSGDPANDKAALDSVALSAPFEPLPAGVPPMPIQYVFEDQIRSGMEQISVSDRNASINLSNSAIDLTNNKEYEQALDKLDFAFEKDPKNPSISHVLRNIAAYVNDDTPDKVHLLYRILALDPQQHGAIEKLRILHRASGIDPDSVSQRMELGESLLKKWDAEGALVEFTSANSIKPNSCPQEKIVEVYRVLAGQRMARKWLVYAKIRKDVETLCGLGRSYQLAGDYEKSEDYYKQALALDQTSDMAKNLKAKLEEEKKTGVREKVNTVMVEHNTGEAGKADLISRAHILNNEGIDELNAGNYAGAIETFKKALTADPLDEHARDNLSTAFNNFGTKAATEAEKVQFYRKALFVSPTNKHARTNLTNHIKYEGKNPDAFDDRMKLAEQFATAGDYTSAAVEVREALSKKKDTAAQNKLKEYSEKAPALP